MAEFTFGIVQIAAEEVRSDPSYMFDNQNRPDGSGLVVQLTIGGAAFFRDAEGERMVAPGYAMLFSHAEPSVYGYPPNGTEPYRHQYIEFTDCQTLRAVFAELIREFGAIVSIPENSLARGVFNEILERFRTGEFDDRYHESELLYRLLISIYREQIERTRGRNPIEFGYHYILNRFRYASNLKGVAAACGVSREYFAREFKRRYRQSPGGFLKQLRIKHAESLLKTTSMPVEEIAVASGFVTANAFIRRFKQSYGVSPGAFRDRVRKQKQNRRPI
ncbi:MAG TPA: helix-turn-helix transcriptional regulator [Opitutaceae bacterium]